MRRKIVFIGVTLLAVGIVTIILSLVQLPFQEQESYDVSQSSKLINESFILPSGGTINRTVILKEGDVINIDYTDNTFVEIIGGGFNFSIRNDQNSLVISDSRNNFNGSMTIPFNASWIFVWDNSPNPMDIFTTKSEWNVTATISKVWTETTYFEVTKNHTIIPAEFSTITEYIGIALILAGIGFMGLGLKFNPKIL